MNETVDPKTVNLLEYVYQPEDLIQIPGNLLYGLMQVLRQVKDSETHTVFTTAYATKAKEVFSKEDKNLLEKVELELKQYPSAQSYFEQQPVEATTMLGNASLDLLLLLQQIHLDNINSGIAKPVGTFTKEPDARVTL